MFSKRHLACRTTVLFGALLSFAMPLRADLVIIDPDEELIIIDGEPFRLDATVDWTVSQLNLAQLPQTVQAFVEFPAGYWEAVGTTLLDRVAITAVNGLAVHLPTSSLSTIVGDADGDQVPDLLLSFECGLLSPFLATGAAVPIHVEGMTDMGMLWAGDAPLRVTWAGPAAVPEPGVALLLLVSLAASASSRLRTGASRRGSAEPGMIQQGRAPNDSSSARPCL